MRQRRHRQTLARRPSPRPPPRRRARVESLSCSERSCACSFQSPSCVGCASRLSRCATLADGLCTGPTEPSVIIFRVSAFIPCAH
uniref:Uncharacterized protein n=1 Tax=uncultured marine virus TaxID=186617 RepID=A0A0F7L7Z6_9VIRU|nr:hypothetical protein [uncultured marine virus]